MLNDQELEALKEQHGDVRDIVLIDDDGNELQIVLRKPRADREDPKLDEFFGYWSRRAVIEQTPKQADPTQDGTAELLRCLVSPDIMIVRRHLGNYPGDAADLRDLLNELAGGEQVKDAPELITEQVKTEFHRRAFGMTVAGKPVVARPMSAAEYSKFLAMNGGGLYPMRAEALAWAAWCCVSEPTDKDKKKPGWDALVKECPMAAILIGVGLLGAAKSRVKEREKKSLTPSTTPSGKPGAESSIPGGESSMPSQQTPEAQTAAPVPST